jgi:murein L,D-transpeptidase YafK
MGKALLAILVLAAAVVAWLAWARSRQQPTADLSAAEIDPSDRVATARRARAKIIEAKYRAAGVTYPGEVFVRWLKREAALELWARNDGRRFHLVATYPILASSGLPGPKRREGDRQVPEGFYEMDRFNPQSSYHLSLGLNYPNAADLVHADPQQPGSDIFIHGSNQSIGCAPLGDEAIEELYLAALDARATGQQWIAVHVFPARMTGAEWERFAAQETASRPELAEFWAQLRPGYKAFEQRRLVPEIAITDDGSYVLKAR